MHSSKVDGASALNVFLGYWQAKQRYF